jgi:hypothetical protein
MTKKLEEFFDLRPIEDAIGANTPEGEEEDAEEKAARIVKALSTAEKVDHSLATVTGIDDHDREMDEIAREALESYMELKELGQNQSDAHSARMMEVAANMLRTALDARDAKVARKLKTLDLQLKRLKLEQDAKRMQKGPASPSANEEDGYEFNRNELLNRIVPRNQGE